MVQGKRRAKEVKAVSESAEEEDDPRKMKATEKNKLH